MNRKEKVYAFLKEQATVPLSEKEIAAMLSVPVRDVAELRLILEELTFSGEITCHRGRYSAKKPLSDEAMLSAILHAHGFPKEFPDAVRAEAYRVPTSVENIGTRRDLRSLLTFTIDGADARDFDDQ